MLRNLEASGRITWASKIRELLFRYGFGYVWLAEDVGDLNLFMINFKQRLFDCSKQDWCAKIFSRQNKALQIYNASTTDCKLC